MIASVASRACVAATAAIGAAELRDGTQGRGGGGAKHAAQDVYPQMSFLIKRKI